MTVNLSIKYNSNINNLSIVQISLIFSKLLSLFIYLFAKICFEILVNNLK